MRKNRMPSADETLRHFKFEGRKVKHISDDPDEDETKETVGLHLCTNEDKTKYLKTWVDLNT